MTPQQLFEQAQKERDNGEITEAIRKYLRVREHVLGKNSLLAAECLHMIGVSYYQADNYKAAEENLKNSQMEFNQQGNQDFVGIVLRDRGLVAYKEKDYKRAKEFIVKSIELLKISDKPDHLGISKVKLGVVYAAEERMTQAEKVIREGIEDIQKSSNTFFESTGYFNLAQVQNQKGEKEESRESAGKALELLNSCSSQDQFTLRRQDLVKFLS